jgi:hypothetical protein
LTDPGSIEGGIRHSEALTREAEVRFFALSRAGLDSNWPRHDPTPLSDVLAPGGQLVGTRVLGAGSDARTVSAAEFESVRSEFMVSARQMNADPRYDGVRYERGDGSVFGLRLSRDNSLTLDVLKSNTPSIKNGFRIHQR